jgi:hypothetical protein
MMTFNAFLESVVSNNILNMDVVFEFLESGSYEEVTDKAEKVIIDWENVSESLKNYLETLDADDQQWWGQAIIDLMDTFQSYVDGDATSITPMRVYMSEELVKKGLWAT